jgi:hypothetical protein
VTRARLPLAAITSNTTTAASTIATKSKGKGKATAVNSSTAAATAPYDGASHSANSSSKSADESSYGLYPAWYRGDGLVLPLQQSLELVGAFVMQELRSRQQASSSSGSGSSSGALVAATDGLTEFLVQHGALQLCLRVLAGMSLMPEHALGAFHTALMGLSDKVMYDSYCYHTYVGRRVLLLASFRLL